MENYAEQVYKAMFSGTGRAAYCRQHSVPSGPHLSESYPGIGVWGPNKVGKGENRQEKLSNLGAEK